MIQRQTIRRPLFDGVREVKALWFEPELMGDKEARRRVLSHWSVGARLYEVRGGFLLEFAQSQFAHCSDLDGQALCVEGGVLSSAPLMPDERSLNAMGTVWLIRDAQVNQVSLTTACRIDPASWLDLSDLPLLTPLQLPRPKMIPIPNMPEPNSELRQILNGSIPPRSSESKKFLSQANAAIKEGKGRSIVKASIAKVAFAPLSILGLIAGIFGARQVATGSGGTNVKHSGLSPMAKRFSDVLAKLAMLTRASKVIGWRQAAYLRKMVNLFESGDLHDALRHAIPLDSLGGPDKRQALGAPDPRTNLDIIGPNQVSSNIGLDAELQNYLRKTYRSTFERLDREGKVDEATFVLAELLKCGEEAVTYLERKGRLKQAAQLAETMELSRELIARLWCLGGDIDRAMHVARLGRAFSGVVKLLESKHSPHASTMRKQWAEDLASSGSLIEAIEVIWALEGERATALDWLLQASQAGGDIGLRALIRKLALLPESFQDSRIAITAILEANGEDGAGKRARMACELLSLPIQSAGTKRLATSLVRSVLPERMAGMNQIDHREMRKLIDLSDALGLKADLPSLQLPKVDAGAALIALATPLHLLLDERGVQAIHDACALDGGDILLALGEIGVTLIDKKGRQLLHFPIPAHHLVLSENGLRALALARRDGVMRISQIDLITRKMSDWIMQEVSFWDDSYDGLTWNAVINNRLVAVDTTHPHLAISWQVGDLPGNIVAYTGDIKSQTMLIASDEDVQQWRYALPSRRLMQRDSFPLPMEGIWRLLPNPASQEPLILKLLRRDEPAILHIFKSGNGSHFELPLHALADEPDVSLKEGLLLIQYQSSATDCRHCIVIDIHSLKTLADIKITHSILSQVKVSANCILLFDQVGRLLIIERSSSQCRILNVL